MVTVPPAGASDGVAVRSDSVNASCAISDFLSAGAVARPLDVFMDRAPYAGLRRIDTQRRGRGDNQRRFDHIALPGSPDLRRFQTPRMWQHRGKNGEFGTCVRMQI